MGREFLYLGVSLVLGSYVCITTLEAYSSLRHGEHLTVFHEAFHLWLSAVFIVPTIILYKKYKYEAGMRLHRCRPANVYPHKDRLLGLDWLKLLLASVKNNSMLELFTETFSRVGNTFWVNMAGEWIVCSIEPENLKSVHATNFDAWPISGPRLQMSLTALGPHAIFSSNGKQWQEARATIRPSFVRDQLADLECFDRHVSNLLARIPKDGGMVDLKKLFYMMTVDSSTDFM
jgi:hypothetical protein